MTLGRSVSSKLSFSTRFVCVQTSFSTNFWSSLFLLWEWIHPSIDQHSSHADPEHTTPETLYVNQTSSLNKGNAVHLSVTPSRNVAIQVAWGSLSISGWKHHEHRPWPRHQNDTVHSILSVTIAIASVCVPRKIMDYTIACLEPTASTNISYCAFILLKSLPPGALKILHHWPGILFDTGIHVPPTKLSVHCKLIAREHEKHSSCLWTRCTASCGLFRPDPWWS
jgi:hypothetical protein